MEILSERPEALVPERVFVGLGSNLGEREENLHAALKRISELEGTQVVRVSTFLETPPWGVEDQPAFINAVAELKTALSPEELLRQVKAVEVELGRVPSYRWGPRLIDIDLLMFGDRILHTDSLTLPHPNILSRPFVWEPFEEIAPEVVEKLRRATLSL